VRPTSVVTVRQAEVRVLAAGCDFHSQSGRGARARVVDQCDKRVGGLTLLHVLDLRSPDGLAEPVA
jgi:hypothetical protein